MVRPRVLVIITGGTICMRPSVEEGVSMKGLSCETLEDYFRQQPEFNDKALPEFDIHEWTNLVDSSDLTSNNWVELAQEIGDRYNDYSGFVILHGTDALAYTASALSFMLEDLGKCVVLTGSMLPMSHVHTDAKKNVVLALLTAGFGSITEVVVVFGSKILRGSRVQKVNCTNMEAFDSPNFPALGNAGIDLTLELHLLTAPPTNPFKPFLQMRSEAVIALTITPGFPPSIIRHVATTKERPLGVILQLFGTGTAPTGNQEFIDAVQSAIDAGVTFVALTQCPKGTCSLQTYANGVKLHEMGLIEGKDLTVEAAFAKLSYLFGKGFSGTELRDLMETDLRGELTKRVAKITGQGTLKPVCNLVGAHTTEEASGENLSVWTEVRDVSPAVPRRCSRMEAVAGREDMIAAVEAPRSMHHADFIQGVTYSLHHIAESNASQMSPSRSKKRLHPIVRRFKSVIGTNKTNRHTPSIASSGSASSNHQVHTLPETATPTA